MITLSHLSHTIPNLENFGDLGHMIIFGHPACVLIDTGSHRSYISEIFARHSDRQLEPLEEEILVTTPLGEQLIRDSFYRSCRVQIGERVLEVDLISLVI